MAENINICTTVFSHYYAGGGGSLYNAIHIQMLTEHYQNNGLVTIGIPNKLLINSQ